MQQPTNKRIMYEMYGRQLFGNQVRSYSRLGQFLNSPIIVNDVLWAIRTTNKVGGRFLPNLSIEEVVSNYSLGDNISEQIDLNITTIQGEIGRSWRGYELRYATVPGYFLRDGLALHGKHAHGLTALLILKQYLDESSYDTIMELFDTYPDSIIEFTSYKGFHGVYNHNTVIWEVRVCY